MPCNNPRRRFGVWVALAVAIAVASMPSSEQERQERPAAAAVERSPVRITLTFPIN